MNKNLYFYMVWFVHVLWLVQPAIYDGSGLTLLHGDALIFGTNPTDEYDTFYGIPSQLANHNLIKTV